VPAQLFCSSSIILLIGACTTVLFVFYYYYFMIIPFTDVKWFGACTAVLFPLPKEGVASARSKLQFAAYSIPYLILPAPVPSQEETQLLLHQTIK